MPTEYNTPPSESIWKRLTRLFRSGPIVRHKIAAGEKAGPVGSASAYKKELSSLYNNSLNGAQNWDRIARYQDYEQMESTPICSAALNVLADEVTAENEDHDVIEIISKNPVIKKALEILFFEVLNINFNAWSWTRNVVKNGDAAFMVDASEENGILNLIPIPINDIERLENYDKSDPMAFKFKWLSQNKILEAWQIIHMRLIGNEKFLPYGVSVVEPARRVWRQLILIEDAMLVYRIIRAPERRVFYIDVGAVPPQEMDQFMEKIKNRMKKNQIVDPETNKVDLRYNVLSLEEDIYIPVRDQRSSRIETLAGGQNLNDIEDVQYIQSSLLAALPVPKAYLNYAEDVGSKSILSQLDVRFSRTISRIQRVIIAELCKIAIIHLFLMGFKGEDLVDFEIRMASSSTIAEQQKLEIFRSKVEVLATIPEGWFSKDWLYDKIFNLNDEEIEKIKEGMREDRLEQLVLENMQLPPEAGGTQSAEQQPVEGEEQQAQTLGGPEPSATEEEPVTQEPDGGSQVVATEEGKKRLAVRRRGNKGSAGNDSAISATSGKNLFSTGEDQYNLVFGTKKQTSSDPFDTRAARRLITRPMSESVDDSLSEGIRKVAILDKEINEELRRIIETKQKKILSTLDFEEDIV